MSRLSFPVNEGVSSPRSFKDYMVSIDGSLWPAGVELAGLENSSLVKLLPRRG